MSYDLNKVLVTGRLGDRPELKSTVHGKPYARVSLAIHGYDAKNKEKTTQWQRVVVWGDQAKRMTEYLDKGSRVLIEGVLVNREYTVDGQTKYSSHVSAQRVQFLGGKMSAVVTQTKNPLGAVAANAVLTNNDSDNGEHEQGDLLPMAGLNNEASELSANEVSDLYFE